ncbi:MAG: hypothetical protein K0R41_1179 [Geminicoccaceae bacterium]|jgi:hypothetical protein|nr:hypothetical protein [Geminicoccaceae bacterium]
MAAFDGGQPPDFTFGLDLSEHVANGRSKIGS